MTSMLDDLQRRVEEVLSQSFDLRSFESSDEGPGRMTVRVVSPDFNDLDDVERQVRVWEVLREHFSEEELLAMEYVFTEAEVEDDPEECVPTWP